MPGGPKIIVTPLPHTYPIALLIYLEFAGTCPPVRGRLEFRVVRYRYNLVTGLRFMARIERVRS